MPKKGFILVDPMILISSGSVDRSERLFVPYTFVDACKEAGKIIPQIFMVEHGIVDLPIAMHIHESIANPELRSTLTTQILVRGHCLIGGKALVADIVLGGCRTRGAIPPRHWSSQQ